MVTCHLHYWIQFAEFCKGCRAFRTGATASACYMATVSNPVLVTRTRMTCKHKVWYSYKGSVTGGLCSAHWALKDTIFLDTCYTL